jgi:hypothetical protein
MDNCGIAVILGGLTSIIGFFVGLGIFLAWDGHRQNKKIEKLFKQIKNEQGEQGKEV